MSVRYSSYLFELDSKTQVSRWCQIQLSSPIFLQFGMFPFENESGVEYSKLAAAWGVRVGWTLLGLLVV